MKYKGTIILIISLLFVYACGKPSVENETKKYNVNQTTIKKLARKYPAFHSQLLSVSRSAYKHVVEAKKINEADRKAEKIALANEVFYSSELYRNLNSLDLRSGSILDKRIKVGQIYSRKYKQRIQSTVKSTDATLNEVSNLMKNARISGSESALATIKRANGLLIDAEHKLDRVTKLTKKKKTSSKKKKRKKT